VPLLINHQRWREGWGSAPATVLTLHNLAYQGIFPPTEYQLTNLPWDYWHSGVEFFGAMNCLKAGICHADALTTVSPRYAREILTEQFGFGLDGVLRQREDDLVGIMNGVDYDEWKTVGNPYLKHDYSARNLRGKALEKAALQGDLGLPVRHEVPLFGNITRMVDQKGSDLILGALEEMLGSDIQYVQLGSGMPALESAFEHLARRHPRKVAVRIGYDAALAHRIEAGCDFFLMPSRYEPCGLNQLYSMRYGTIPVVRSTGGLDDAVTDVNEDPDKANGIEFREATAQAVAAAIRKALALYSTPRVLRRFRQRAMAMDFSWEGTARHYLRVYRRVAGLE
jgi:starch synthase